MLLLWSPLVISMARLHPALPQNSPGCSPSITLDISVSVRELARFIEKAMATVWAIFLATLHYRVLQKLIPSTICSQSAAEKFSVILYLSQEARVNLTWWTESIGDPYIQPSGKDSDRFGCLQLRVGATNGQEQTQGL